MWIWIIDPIYFIKFRLGFKKSNSFFDTKHSVPT